MNDNNRRYFTPEQKVAILREHLIEGKSVSDLCDKYHIHPTLFYQWQREDFKEFIRLAGLTHVRTSPYYPQSNGKIERWYQSLKVDCLRPGCPLSQQDGARLIERFVNHYNTERLHSAIGYVAPTDRRAGRHLDIFAERDRKLELARQNRKIKRQSLTESIIASSS